MIMCCYWIEWMIEFDAVCKSKKQVVRCDNRDYVEDRKYRGDIIWMLWDAIMESCEARADPFVKRVMESLIDIFRAKYTTASAKKRRYIMYMAVELLTETVVTNTEIVADKSILVNVIENIDRVYKQIKKNEQKGAADYLLDSIMDPMNI